MIALNVLQKKFWQQKTRLDKALKSLLPQISRNKIQSLIEEGKILVDGKKIQDPSFKVRPGVSLTIFLPEETKQQEGKYFITIQPLILYEDDYLLAINKPPGLVVHPAAGHKEDTLVDYLLKEKPEIAEAVYDKKNPVSLLRPGLIHRLDKDTSGVIIIAKNQQVLKEMAKKVEKRQIQKHYLSLLLGELKEPILLNKPLAREKTNRFKMAINKNGKEAITYFFPEKIFYFKKTPLTLANIQPYTGRTHQIRAHALFLNLPVLGDKLYSTSLSQKISEELGAKRQLLHAQSLIFKHPVTKKELVITAPLPKDFSDIMKKIDKTENK